MRATVRRRRRLLVWAALITAVVSTDWPVGVLSGFWVRHSLLTSVAAGLVLLGFAVFVLDVVIEEREALRWRRVADVSYFSLGHLAAEMHEGLHALLAPTTELRSGTLPFGATVLERLHPRLAMAAARSDSQDDIIRHLTEDAEWLVLARHGMEVLKARHREGVAKWIPAMLANSRIAKVIDHVATLDFRRDAVETSMLRIIKALRPDYWDAAAPARDVELERRRLVRLWWELAVELIATQEALMRLARGDDWRNVAAREWLPPHHLPAVEERTPTLMSVLQP